MVCETHFMTMCPRENETKMKTNPSRLTKKTSREPLGLPLCHLILRVSMLIVKK